MMTVTARPARDWTREVKRPAVMGRRGSFPDTVLLKFATASDFMRRHSATQRPAIAAIRTAFPGPARGSRSRPDQRGSHTNPECFLIAERKSPITRGDYLTKNILNQTHKCMLLIVSL